MSSYTKGETEMGALHYNYLTSFKYRDPETLWCFDEEKPNYRIIVDRVTVWLLVYIHERDKYTILARTAGNENNLSLKKFLNVILYGSPTEKSYIESLNSFYRRKYELESSLLIEVQEIVAITPYGRPTK